MPAPAIVIMFYFIVSLLYPIHHLSYLTPQSRDETLKWCKIAVFIFDDKPWLETFCYELSFIFFPIILILCIYYQQKLGEYIKYTYDNCCGIYVYTLLALGPIVYHAAVITFAVVGLEGTCNINCI